jgi:hypothetical protein
MGTADYLLIVVLLFFILFLLAIKQDEKRQADRRQLLSPAPNGLERRSEQNRRGPFLIGYVSWAVRSQWAKLRKWF